MKNITTFLFLVLFSVHLFAQKSDDKTSLIVEKVNQFVAKTQESDIGVNKKLIDFAKSINTDNVSTSEYSSAMLKLSTIINETDKNYLNALFTLGELLQDKHEYKNAYTFFYKIALELENTPQEFNQICEFYEYLGHNYYFFRRRAEAEITLLKAVDCSNSTDKSKINSYNTLGLIYRNKKEFSKSEKYFRIALGIANRTNDIGWSGVLMGNIGEVSFSQNKFEEARKFLLIDYEQGLKNNQLESSINALALLIRVDMAQNKLESARVRFKTLDSLFNANKTIELEAVYLVAKVGLLKKSNDYKGALEAVELLRLVLDTLNQRRDLVNIKNTEFQIEFERKQSEIKLLTESNKLDADRIKAMWFAMTSLLIGGAITIWQISKRRKREKELLKLKNEQMGLELKMSERELRNVLRNLMEKNTVITEMNDELENLQKQNSQSNLEHDALTKTLQSFTLLTEEDWLEFKRLFEKCYRGFFEYFNTNFEDITNAEMRLAALIKLDLENLEMSNALGISPDSVRKTNLRLRKRVGIAEQKELQKFIQSI